MSVGITVGASEQAIKEARQIILEILKMPCGDNVKQLALETLGKMTSVNGTSVTNCNFTVK